MQNLIRSLVVAAVVSTSAGKPNFLYASSEAFAFSSETGSSPDSEAFAFSSETGNSSESYLGVDTRDVTPDRLSALRLKEEKGVEVTMVDQDAPAGKAGLKEHDVILTVNGTEVESVEQLRRMIHEIPSGRLISLGLSRNGQPLTLKAQLAARQKGFAMAWPQGNNSKVNLPPFPSIPPVPPMADMDMPVSVVVVHSSTRSGLMVENLTPQLGDFFGVKDGQGILVRSVERGSRAEHAGFHAGDVIVRVNGETINDSGDFSHAINSRKQSPASVTVMRDKKQVTLTLTLPDHGPSGVKVDESANTPISKSGEDELSEVQSEVANLGPEMLNAAKEIRLQTAEIQRLRPEIEKAANQAREEVKKELKELQRRLRSWHDENGKSTPADL